MHKIMQLILNFLYKKNMFPFMQLHVYYVNFMKITIFGDYLMTKLTLEQCKSLWKTCVEINS
jgi:hypothetical protein